MTEPTNVDDGAAPGDTSSDTPAPVGHVLVGLAQAKAHLRVVDSAEDADISLKLRASIKACEAFIERKLCTTEEELQAALAAGQRAVLVDDLLNAGILLLLGHLYTNREDVVTGTIATQLPKGAEYCWSHARYIGV